MKKMKLLFVVSVAAAVTYANPIPERVKGLEKETCTFRVVGPGGGGWIQSMLLSRHAPNRFFVGCDVGGFYYSENGGRSYEMRNRGLKHLFIETIAEHPVNPDILFLGSQGGIYKTTDRGRTWQEKRSGLPPISAWEHTVQISKFAFLPGNPDVLFALVGQPRTGKGARGEIWRSDDCGETWRMIVKSGLAKDVNLFDVSIDPRDGRRMLVASNRGLFRSENGGEDWTPSNEGLPAHHRTRHLARCSAQPDVVYVTLRQRGGEKPWSAGVYRSDDGGRTWCERSGGLDRRFGSDGCGDELCTWTDCIAVHPENPDIAWTGGASWWYTGILKTEDGGQNWRQTFNADRGWISFWGPSVKTMTLSGSDPNRLAFGTSGMVYATEDGGGNWEQRYYRDLGEGRFAGTGLEVTCLHTIVPSIHRRGRFYLGYYDIGLLVTDDDGRSMTRKLKGIPHDYSNSCFALAEAPDDSQLLWGCFGSWGGPGKAVLARSSDAAETWQPCTNGASGWNGAAPNSLLVMGKKPNYKLLTASAKGLAISVDGGATWQVPSDQFPEAGRVRFLAKTGETVYAAVAGTVSEPASVFACRDGTRWERLTTPKVRIADLHGLSAEGNRVLVTARENFNHTTKEFRPGGAWLSTDTGVTWKKVWTDKFVDAALVSRGELYIALGDNPYHDHCGGAGVLHSVDDGATWTYLDGPTLQNWNVHALAMDPNVPQRLWMGTAGNSIFVLEKNTSNLK